MNLERYPFLVSNENSTYEFYSEGPNGRIRKVIRYTEFQSQDQYIYNLAFGDWIENGINDLSISNNQDRQKVLATVAFSIIHFTNLHPKALIYAEGSTNARTRLYQMAISTFHNEINENFKIFGLLNEEWHLFIKGINYDAFLVVRK